MGILEIILIAGIIGVAVLVLVCVILMSSINERNQALYGEIFERLDELEKSKDGFVTDPFEKPKETFSSTTHIIQPKTPDQIRNENYKKIVDEGKMYGSII